jgi:hypothetical protein
MPTPPPLKDTLDALQQDVLPGAGGAALVLVVFLLFGRGAAALGSAAAVVVAFVWGNFAFTPKDEDPVPTWNNTWRLLHWKPAADDAGTEWLPRAALVLLIVGLISRWLGLASRRVQSDRAWWGANVLVWGPRATAVVVVSAWLVLGKAAEAEEWAGLRWELAAAMLLVWVFADGFARGGFSAEVSAYLGACLFAGSVIVLYAHSSKPTEIATLVGSALFGIAAVTALAKPGPPDAKVHATGAIPSAVAFLPGLLLGGRPSLAEHKVPDICFWLVALAPLALAPFLIPRIARQNRWLLLGLRLLLVLAPLVAAVVLAGQHEKFAYEQEPEW